MDTSLAKFVAERREDIGLSQKGLALKCNLSVTVIENIEAGQDLFLSTTVRQKLARGLKVESYMIKVLERPPVDEATNFNEYIDELKQRIVEGHIEGNICPVCKSELICRVAEMYDLEDNLIRHPKARCSKCPFQIR